MGFHLWYILGCLSAGIKAFICGTCVGFSLWDMHDSYQNTCTGFYLQRTFRFLFAVNTLFLSLVHVRVFICSACIGFCRTNTLPTHRHMRALTAHYTTVSACGGP